MAITRDTSQIVSTVSDLQGRLQARQMFSAPTIQINSTTTPADVFNVTTNSMLAGSYRLEISYLWNSNATNRDIITTLLVDGAAVSQDSSRIHVQRPANANNLGDVVAGTGSGNRWPYYMVFPLTFGAVGTHTLLMQFRARVAGTNVSLWDATMYLYKVDV